MPSETRFWTKVNKNGPVPIHRPELGRCWIWTAGTVKGYGQFNASRQDGKQHTVTAHRYAWELTHGPIEGGLFVLHHCDVPLCCNTAGHLFLGTQQVNLNDARAKGRLDESRPRTRVLTPAMRQAIFDTPARPGIGVALARQYGVSKTCISLIRLGRFTRPVAPVFERVPHVDLPVRGVLHLGKQSAPSAASVVNPILGSSEGKAS